MAFFNKNCGFLILLFGLLVFLMGLTWRSREARVVGCRLMEEGLTEEGLLVVGREVDGGRVVGCWRKVDGRKVDGRRVVGFRL